MADQQVKEAEWLTRRNMSNQIAGRMCAMGAFHGSFGAGDKPTDIMGMIGSGMAQSFIKLPSATNAANKGSTYSNNDGAPTEQPFNFKFGVANSMFTFNESGGMASQRIELEKAVNDLYAYHELFVKKYGYTDYGSVLNSIWNTSGDVIGKGVHVDGNTVTSTVYNKMSGK